MDTAHHWLAHLIARRLVFVMGKGGVGKTTVSIALAMEAARLSRKVLLAEVGDSNAMGPVLDGQALSDEPRRIMKNIWGARVNPRSELEAYVRTHVAPAFIARRIIRSRLFEYLIDAAPGLKEIMSLGRIWRWVTGTDDPDHRRFDLVIVDAPATGHALSLLRLPRQLIAMIRFGPLVAQMKKLRGLLENHEQTCLALVTLPEELPVSETIEFYPVAANTLNMSVAATFINGVYPALFTNEEASRINKLSDAMTVGSQSDHDICRALLEAASRYMGRRSMQNGYINRIHLHAAPNTVFEIPFYFTNDLSIDDISRIFCTFRTRRTSGETS